MMKIYRSKTLTYIVLLLIQQSKCEVTSIEREKEIAALEKEKGELFKQINSAIDESVTLLNKTNDTHTVMGTSFLKQLKMQLKEINETGVPFHEEEIQGRFLNDTRRKEVKIDLFDIAKVFKMNKYDKDNHEIMQKKVDEWLLQKESEKKKIRDYKHKLKEKNVAMKREKCPRDGVGKSDKKKDGEKKGHKYPCCRKCCKKSYMGCL